MRGWLERELGETISRRLAARLLGVSHTALGRWINDGDLPVVYSTKGRSELPMPALLELYENVMQTREEGGQRYVLAPTMTRQRQAARRLRIDSITGDEERRTRTGDGPQPRLPSRGRPPVAQVDG